MRSVALRVFAFLWLALTMLAGAGVGALIWAASTLPDGARVGDLERSAAEALARGGRDGLAAWLRDAPHGPTRAVFLLDDEGRDLLGRRTPERWRGLGRATASVRANAVQIIPPEPFTTLAAADGTRYRMILLPPPGSPIAGLASSGARWLLVAVVLLVTGLVSALLARTITRPIHQLEAATQLLAEGEFEEAALRATLRRKDEIGRLAGSIHRLALRLRDLIGDRERLLRDLSHELRSPLARMQVALGLARQSDDAIAGQLPRLEREVERLGALIAQILELSRLDAGEVAWQLEPVDLGELVADLLADAEFEGQPGAARIDWRPPQEDVLVTGDARWLGAALENVLRNALAHGGSHGVEVVLRREGTGAVLRVRDHGPGVPEGDLERIFEPFFRARGDGAATPGHGLGLAITARVLAGHGGSARARSAEDGGLIVELALPLAGGVPARARPARAPR